MKKLQLELFWLQNLPAYYHPCYQDSQQMFVEK